MDEGINREGVGNVSAAFKTAQDMIAVVVLIDMLLKRAHPFGETGVCDHPFGADLGIGRPPGGSGGQGRSVSEPGGFSLDGCEHGGMLGKKGRLVHHIRINI